MEFPIRWLVLLINVVLFGGTFVLLPCWLSYRHGKKVGHQEGYISGHKEAQGKVLESDHSPTSK